MVNFGASHLCWNGVYQDDGKVLQVFEGIFAIVRTQPLFKGGGGGVNFDYLPRMGGSEKLKKGG